MEGSGSGGEGLPAGFRFMPTDEELLEFYLVKKIEGELPDNCKNVVPEKQLYGVGNFAPWQVFKLDDGVVIGDTMQSESEEDQEEEETNAAAAITTTSLASALEDKSSSRKRKRAAKKKKKKPFSSKWITYAFTTLNGLGQHRYTRHAGLGAWNGRTGLTRIRNKDNKLIGFKKMLNFEITTEGYSESEIMNAGHWIMNEYSLAGVSLKALGDKTMNAGDYVICRIKRDTSKPVKMKKIENSKSVKNKAISVERNTDDDKNYFYGSTSATSVEETTTTIYENMQSSDHQLYTGAASAPKPTTVETVHEVQPWSQCHHNPRQVGGGSTDEDFSIFEDLPKIQNLKFFGCQGGDMKLLQYQNYSDIDMLYYNSLNY